MNGTLYCQYKFRHEENVTFFKNAARALCPWCIISHLAHTTYGHNITELRED